VTEVAGKDNGLELVDVLDDKLDSGGGPVDDLSKLLILTQTTTTLRISKVFEINPATSVVSGSSS